MIAEVASQAHNLKVVGSNPSGGSIVNQINYMTRLEKYLLATASEIIEAETTVSRYFVIGNIKIRVSDHFSNNADADIQILIPYNGGTKYMVTINGNPGLIV